MALHVLRLLAGRVDTLYADEGSVYLSPRLDDQGDVNLRLCLHVPASRWHVVLPPNESE